MRALVEVYGVSSSVVFLRFVETPVCAATHTFVSFLRRRRSKSIQPDGDIRYTCTSLGIDGNVSQLKRKLASARPARAAKAEVTMACQLTRSEAQFTPSFKRGWEGGLPTGKNPGDSRQLGV